ncbi:MAG TPA: alpha/beta fold hydrolase [Candidatus Acidoferrales bacterium]|nr:alpha/beta fold hydrolase [Candidatus Acidoferrales bacterium]
MIAFFAALSAIVLAAFLSILYVGPRMLLFPHRRTPEYYQQKFGFSHPSQIGLDFKEGLLKTGDGISLSYWEIKPQDSNEHNGAVIYLHGITDSKVSGLNYAKQLSGFCGRVFLIDMRRHGDSGGDYCTFGYYEKHDVVALIDKIESECHSMDITLLGVSMGAAIAVQTAAIDKRVSRLIAVAPFYDLFSIALDHQVRKIGIRSKVLLKLVLKRAEHLAKFKASEVSPADDIRRVDVPILIVHGEKDRSVKREYPERLKGLNKNARLMIVADAGHVDVLEKGGKDYLKELVEFMRSDGSSNPLKSL